MVSARIIGEPVTGSAKCHYHQRKTPTPKCSAAATAAAGSIFTSLNRSIFTFHRRLLRFVSKLFRLDSTGRGATKQGYKKLEKHEDPPTKNNDRKKTIFLDLDETLVHSTMQPPRVKFDFMVRVKIEEEVMPIFVVKRPGVDNFLEKIGQKYKVAVFTAGQREYASPVLDKLDKNNVISQRLYRDSCKEVDGKYIKDLSVAVGKDLGSVVIVDDNPFSYLLQPENAVPIKPFVDDMKDRELKKLAEFFEGCDGFEDMRDAVKEFLANRLI